MKKRKSRSGFSRGVFFLLAALSVGACAYFWLQRFPDPVRKNLRDFSAWTQRECRLALAESGVTDDRVRSSFNRERRSRGVLWVESTLEVTTPPGWRRDLFLRRLRRTFKAKGLVCAVQEEGPGVWSLEAVSSGRVHQRIVFLSAR